ncbi:hypothetical protein B0H34DRAFT_674207 [Crassisporium funariophilum]|nr:hypothetical protein B0H34DRAFT_674207 [Crassisporium funariophilum]
MFKLDMIIDEIHIIPTSHLSPSPVMRDSVLKVEAERPSSGFSSHHQAITGIDVAWPAQYHAQPFISERWLHSVHWQAMSNPVMAADDCRTASAFRIDSHITFITGDGDKHDIQRKAHNAKAWVYCYWQMLLEETWHVANYKAIDPECRLMKNTKILVQIKQYRVTGDMSDNNNDKFLAGIMGSNSKFPRIVSSNFMASKVLTCVISFLVEDVTVPLRAQVNKEAETESA